MSEQEQGLGRVEGKIDLLIKMMEQHQDEDTQRFEKHSGRLHVVEEAQAEQRGVMKLASWVGAGGFATAALALFKVMFNGNGKHP